MPETIIQPAAFLLSVSPSLAELAENLEALLHGGGVEVYFVQPCLTRQLNAADFTDGVPNEALNARQLAITTGPGKVKYQQTHQKRINQGRTMASRRDVTEENLSLSVGLGSIHGAAGDELRRILSGNKVVGGVYGQNTTAEYEHFSMIFSAENYFRETGAGDFFIGVLFAAASPGFEFELSDEGFALIEADMEADLPPNANLGAGQTFSI